MKYFYCHVFCTMALTLNEKLQSSEIFVVISIIRKVGTEYRNLLDNGSIVFRCSAPLLIISFLATNIIGALHLIDTKNIIDYLLGCLSY